MSIYPPQHLFVSNSSNSISVMWQEHYSHIFNMVNGSNCKELHADLCRHNSVLGPNMIVTFSKIEEIISDLSYNKSLGLDGITSEHDKFASQQLPVLLCILISAIQACYQMHINANAISRITFKCTCFGYALYMHHNYISKVTCCNIIFPGYHDHQINHVFFLSFVVHIFFYPSFYLTFSAM